VKDVVISTSRLNSHGTRILTEGIDYEQYEKNPILLWNHHRTWDGRKDEILPIGNMTNLRIEGDALIGTPMFDETDEFARSIKSKWDAGVLRMCSPGIDMVASSEEEQYLLPGQKYATITKSKLIEISIVDIGANDDALVLSHNGRTLNLKAGEGINFLPLIKKESRMKTIALKLGLSENATEQEVLESIGGLQQTTRTAEGLRGELETLKLSHVNSIVETAVTEKRITAAQKEHFVTLGKTMGSESLRETLKAITPAGKVTDQLHLRGNSGSHVDYKKLSDVPESEVMQLRNEDRTRYVQLFKAEYGFEPVIEE